MQYAKALLIINGLLLAGYGAVCFISPEVPATYMGVDLGSAGGPVEFIAMYGGLEFAFGLYFIRCGATSSRVLEGVRVMAILFAGLGLARLAGLLRIGLDDYNVYAMIYEIGSMLLSIAAWRVVAGRRFFSQSSDAETNT